MLNLALVGERPGSRIEAYPAYAQCQDRVAVPAATTHLRKGGMVRATDQDERLRLAAPGAVKPRFKPQQALTDIWESRERGTGL